MKSALAVAAALGTTLALSACNSADPVAGSNVTSTTTSTEPSVTSPAATDPGSVSTTVVATGSASETTSPAGSGAPSSPATTSASGASTAPATSGAPGGANGADHLAGSYAGTTRVESEGQTTGPAYATTLKLTTAADGSYVGTVDATSASPAKHCVWRLQEGKQELGGNPDFIPGKDRNQGVVGFKTTLDPASKGGCDTPGPYTSLQAKPSGDVVITWGTGAGGYVARLKRVG